MNLQSTLVKPPVRVLIINSFTTASKLLVFKILGGLVFGKLQMISIILLVYENEVPAGEVLKSEIEACAFSRCCSVEVTSNLPSISDADVFCFATNFENPHFLDFTIPLADENFDSFYLLLKVAHHFSLQPPPPESREHEVKPGNKKKNIEWDSKFKMKPLFFTDGLVSLNILYFFSKVIPRDSIFCPSSLPPIAKTVLGDHLKVACEYVNDVRVWAVRNQLLHVEVDMPIVRYDKVVPRGPTCLWKMIGPDMMDELNLDHTQFNKSWLKKEFIDKIISIASANVYGPIYKSHSKFLTIREVFKAKRDNVTVYQNLGIISDGSIGTIKGYAYVMPVVLCGDSLRIDERPGDKDNSYITAVVKNMNNAVYEHHKSLMLYCKAFLEENVINLEFVPGDDDTISYSTPAATTESKLTKSSSSSNSSRSSSSAY